jgi:hypothetical protein
VSNEQADVQAQLLQSLLKKVAADPYPSSTMMNTVEELLTPDTLEAYAKVLLSKIDNDEFPSVPMIDRLRNLAIG